ncbi:hypothetical protein FO519_002499 [Halicephalobus sp. NKZ332]|nr:hypothetical protein FO519_002499 [Halicephalobus sp. NKZ332]
MTITYSLDVASSTLCGIHKLLFRWKGSIWKSIWPELLLWLTAYAGLSFLYRFILTKEHQRIFEDLSVFFYTYGDYIPLTFMLGFYVSAVFDRWKSIFDNLGWIDSPGLLISVYIRGHDETARKIRRNIMRYMVLVQAMVYRDISTCVKKRFPTMDHLVTAGLMTVNELKEFDSIVSPQMKYWVPMNWIFLLIRRAREMNLIESDIIYVDLLEKIRQYRASVLNLTLYDWVPVPLVYTQVVNLAVRTYFLVALLGRQYLVTNRDIPNAKTVDLYFPIMTVFQFLFYIGWMKVAEVLLNPLGDDDDDFECNWVIDRNIQVGLAMVDEACGKVPELEKDIFWNDILPEPLYTQESANRPQNPMIGSCNDLSGEDAFVLQPPRHRFMSAGTINPSDLPQNALPGEVLVPKYNPRGRAYSIYTDSGRSSGLQNDRNKFLASFKRKISRGQKRSLVGDYPFSQSYAEWGYGNGASRPDSASRWNDQISRNDSITSSTLVDGIQTPFSHSLPPQISWNQRNSMDFADQGMLEHASRNLDENQDGQKPNSTNWTINEMLPVIHEEDHEKSRKSTIVNETEDSTKTSRDEGDEENNASIFNDSTDSLEKLKRILRTMDSVSSDSPSNVTPEESHEVLKKIKQILRTSDSVPLDTSSNDNNLEESSNSSGNRKKSSKASDSDSISSGSPSNIVTPERSTNSSEKQKHTLKRTDSLHSDDSHKEKKQTPKTDSTLDSSNLTSPEEYQSERNNLDEVFVKKGIEEDLKNEEIDLNDIFEEKLDENIKFVENPLDWIYRLDYNKSHPFDNDCRFPVIRHDDKEIQKYNIHYRETDCSKFPNESPIVHQHRNGEIIVAKPNRGTVKKFSCFYKELSGALKPNANIPLEVGNWTKLPTGKRILIQKDQFLIQCLSNGSRVFFNAFSWISDKPRLSPPESSGEDKYSINLLVIDSTSRNQFFRNMPLTLRWMRERDFQILQGYTKIGDNSAVNLLSILSGLIYGKTPRGFDGLVEDDGVIDLEAIETDFSHLNSSLIAKAKAAGYVTLWNDEIANPAYGLYHYYDFHGFDHPIADYYYRPYYQYIYKNLKASSGCRNGKPILPKWLEIWEQFSIKYSEKCHFAFNFLTGLTHASANNLELYDVPVSDALGRMESAGVLENTFFVIMGDHGQRISPIQKTTVGRIEERMSFFGIHIPYKFRLRYPEKFENFVKNKNRLTSNFDVHETFEEIFSLSTGKVHEKLKKHGISLFEEIPKNRSCKDALIPENFCLCMEKAEETPGEEFENSLKHAVSDYLTASLNNSCIDDYNYTILPSRTWYAISKMAKAGIRYLAKWEQFKNKDKIIRNIFNVEFSIELRIRKKTKELKMNLLTRVQYYSKIREVHIMSPPWLQSEDCPGIFVLEELCGCLNQMYSK